MGRAHEDTRSPILRALQRKANRRASAIAKTLLPCPKCGCPPQVDVGLLDAPFEPGFEFIYCNRVLSGISGVLEQSCGTSSQGAAAWNWRAAPPSEVQ